MKVSSCTIRVVIEVRYAGVHTPILEEPTDLTIHRPEGFGMWVFMLFTTPFEVETPLGLTVGKPGDVLINDPQFPQWHRGRSVRFHNHWLHLTSDGSQDEILSLSGRYELPLNTPFPLVAGGPVLECLEDIQHEVLLRHRYWDIEADSLVRRLFRMCGRMRFEADSSELTEEEWARFPQFSRIRLAIRGHLRKEWTVERMAQEVNLSSSRFGVLYRKLFKVSPIDDVITARLDHGKALLRLQDLSVSVVAEECGFSSVYYFCRVFKKRFGCSPGTYRKLPSAETVHG